MQEHIRLFMLAVEFENMRRELEQTSDPALLKALLIEQRTRLAVIKAMATPGLHEELAVSN